MAGNIFIFRYKAEARNTATSYAPESPSDVIFKFYDPNGDIVEENYTTNSSHLRYTTAHTIGRFYDDSTTSFKYPLIGLIYKFSISSSLGDGDPDPRNIYALQNINKFFLMFRFRTVSQNSYSDNKIKK